MLQKDFFNKKAVSLMVGYVLLIVIAISLATLVYFYLKQYLPLDKEECPQSVSLAISEANCNLTSQVLKITLINNGYFTVKGLYVKIGNQSALTQINTRTEFQAQIAPVSFPQTVYPRVFDIRKFILDNHVTSGQEFTVSVQPAMISKKSRPILCDSIITQKVTCTS